MPQRLKTGLGAPYPSRSSCWRLPPLRTNLLRFGGTHMQLRSFVAANLVCGLALVFAVLLPVTAPAEDLATAEQPASSSASPTAIKPSAPPIPTTDKPGASAPASPQTAALRAPAADPMIASIRAKLGDASLRKGADVRTSPRLKPFTPSGVIRRCGLPAWGSRPRRKLPSTRSARPMTGG